jgi:threonine dehydratase
LYKKIIYKKEKSKMSKELTLKDIEEAYKRIRPNIKRTLIDYSFNISESLGCNLYLKLEMLQRCKAFKFRGALSKISTLPKGSTIVCASAGNHSQGCALASKICNINCIVYMPETAPQAKVAATRGYGAEVRQYGQTFDDANKKCLEDLEKEKHLIFVPPFDDLDVMAGQGTIGLEIYEDLKDVQTVVVSVGGGGLCAGVATAIKALAPKCRIVAVNAALFPNTYIKYQKEKGREIDPIAESEPKTGKKPLADGIAVKVPGTLTFPYISKYVDEFVVVSEEEISIAIAVLAQRAKCVVEGAGASTLAAVLFKKFKYEKGENIVCILSGGNITLKRLSECFDAAEEYLLKH